MRARPLLLAVIMAAFALATPAYAQLRITLPKSSKPTPVQKLNQDGVKAVKKHDYDKARKLFYQAYLLDPNDPFTLNNLGYMAELDGQADRAERFYALAAQQKTEATIELASSGSLAGKTVAEVAGNTKDKKLVVNQYNLEAIDFLQKDRAPEADLVLQKALKLDPANPFTLNNMGFAKEKEGELEQALSFYIKASNLRSAEPVVVAADRDWRGKGISHIASENADKLRKLMRSSQTVEARVQRLNLEGVSALNRNQPELARRYFEQAYKLDPQQAFTLNNMGYLAELEGDRESANFYYARAQEARANRGKVDVATRTDAEGKQLRDVAETGEQQVAERIEAARNARMRQGGPVLLRNRNGSVVKEPDHPPVPVQVQPRPAPQQQPELLMPLPDSQQPGNQQTPAPQPNAGQGNGAPSGGLLMPLPENQQPPVAREPANPQTSPAPQQQPQGGLLMPLPENQQPPAVRQPANPQTSPAPQQQQPPQQ